MLSACFYQDGAVRWAVGDDVVSFWRSAAKPFQLCVSLEQLPAELTRSISDRELSIGAASHSGEPEHVALVAAMLQRLGGHAHELQCGAHAPMHEPSARAVASPTQLHSNCSGKHTFMLTACRYQHWPLDYRPADHPLQQRNRERLASITGNTPEIAIDGCSIPTFASALSAQAKAWAYLACAMADNRDELGRIGWAMHREPWFMSGTDRLDATVVLRASEPLTVKIGAEGLFCIAMPNRRAGLAVKCHSGNSDALAVGVKAVLEHFDVRLAEPWPWCEVRNVRDVLVGQRRAIWQ